MTDMSPLSIEIRSLGCDGTWGGFLDDIGHVDEIAGLENGSAYDGRMKM